MFLLLRLQIKFYSQGVLWKNLIKIIHNLLHNPADEKTNQTESRHLRLHRPL